MITRILLFTLLLGVLSPLGAVVRPVVAVDPVQQDRTEEIKQELKEYRASLQNMDRKERRALKKEQRKAAKAAMKEFKQHGDVDLALLVVLAILLPPLAVYLHEGAINNRFWISLVLTLLFFIPGIIYALIVVLGD